MRRAVLIQFTTAECLWDSPASYFAVTLCILETQQQSAAWQIDAKENADRQKAHPSPGFVVKHDTQISAS